MRQPPAAQHDHQRNPPKMSLQSKFLSAMALCVTIIGIGLTVIAHQHSTTICSNNPCYVQMPNNGVTGLQITDSKGSVVDNPFYIEDWNHDPMFWVNVGGAFSGAQEICVTALNIFQRMPACIKPNGTLTLNGQTLTAADIRKLHQIIRAGR